MKKGKKTHAESISLKLKDQASFNNKVKSLKAKLPSSSSAAPAAPSKSSAASKGPGVIFIKHIPHGFYEKQMKAYFSQFGDVNRLRISRSKKSARSKGYGYIEFRDEEVAKIAASSMNNYLMFHHLIKCEFVPKDKLHPQTFKGAGKVFRESFGHNVNRKRQNKIKTPATLELNAKKRLKKLQKTLGKLTEAGVNYSLPVDDKIQSQEKEQPYVENQLASPVAKEIDKVSKDVEESSPVAKKAKQEKSPIAKKSKQSSPSKQALSIVTTDKVASPVAKDNKEANVVAKETKQSSVVKDTKKVSLAACEMKKSVKKVETELVETKNEQSELFDTEDWSDDDDDDDDDDDIDFDAMFGMTPTRELLQRSCKTPNKATPSKKTPVKKTPGKKTPMKAMKKETTGSETRKRKATGALTRNLRKRIRT